MPISMQTLKPGKSICLTNVKLVTITGGLLQFYLTLTQYSSTRIPVGRVPFKVSVSCFKVYK